MHTLTPTLSRKAAIGAATLLLMSGVAVVTAPTAAAGNCTTKAGVQLCGAVKNRSGRTMSTTQGFSGSNRCDVWNWDGGPGGNRNVVDCDQRTMGNGTKGGNGTGVDIDAFTFNGEGYHERFSRIGTWNWRTKGVWTKVRDGEIADCGIGDGNEIWCTVLWQADL